MSNQSRLEAIVESIERQQDVISEHRTVIAEQKTNASGLGYSKKVLAQVLRRRKMSITEREEEDALLELYETELGMRSGRALGDAAIGRLERARLAREAQDQPNLFDKPKPEGDDEEPAAPIVEETEDEARLKGAQAARDGVPIIKNPYPPRTPQRAAWDEAWCREAGSDGMDLPEAWKPTPKPKKPEGEDGGDEGGDEGDGE